MVKWPNAPLVYTVGLVRFFPVPRMDRFVDGFHDAVRGEYPDRAEITAQSVNASFGPDGFRVDQAEEPLWQFTAADRSHAFILGGQFLVLHAGVDYVSHTDFASRMSTGLAKLIALPEIGVGQALAVGFRYVDLVVPRADRGEALSAYLKPWVFPAAAPDLVQGGRLELKEEVHLAAFQTDLGMLRFQALRCPPTTLPPELDTPFVRENDWVPSRPKGEFALLDIDHGTQFPTPLPLDPEMVADHLIKLRDVPYELFLQAATPSAVAVWRNEA